MLEDLLSDFLAYALQTVHTIFLCCYLWSGELRYAELKAFMHRVFCHYREPSSVAIRSANYDFTIIYKHIHVRLFPFDIFSEADLLSNPWNTTIILRHLPSLL